MGNAEAAVENLGNSRDKVIIRTSIIGIFTNVMLAAFKAAVGVLSHSIAVTLDAVNNLSDALSSIITIFGTKLAGRSADRKHPLGHGRIEYLSALLVSGIVLYAGITSAVESVKKIIHPEKAEYSAVSLLIIAVAIGVKLAVLLLAAIGVATMWMAVFADVGVTVLAVLNAMRTLKCRM